MADSTTELSSDSEENQISVFERIRSYVIIRYDPIPLFFLLASAFLLIGLKGSCNLVCVAYPLVKTFETLPGMAQSQRQQWLTYWVLVSAFNLFEIFSSTILRWIPFYYGFKALFFIWCMAPQYNGAQFLYLYFIDPLLSKPKSEVDQVMKHITETTIGLGSEDEALLRKENGFVMDANVQYIQANIG